ncbi:hypothetical protein, partial [Chryseobacterium sp. CH25]|uniref:hypothetical protein n=1 Tax=Chryseobacterium sp. CH25 TaxID=713559 RepID=UPI001E2D2464
MGEVVTNQAEAVAGDHYNFRLNLISRAANPVVLEDVKWLIQSESFNRKLSKDSLITIQHDVPALWVRLLPIRLKLLPGIIIIS